MKSFVHYTSDSDFPIQNIPFGVISTKGSAEDKRPASRIGDFAVDLRALATANLFNGPLLKQHAIHVFSERCLNEFMALGKGAWREARATLQKLLSVDDQTLQGDEELKRKVLIPMSDVIVHLPADIGDYTDFYASKEHATNVGIMFRGKENALMPNWTHLPVGYHGRASSIVVSGTDLHRPCGQRNTAPKGEQPKTAFGPSQRLDIELEMAFFIGSGNKLGESVSVDNALDHVFGAVLMNDWSARDIQAWEYVPLGPFLGKNFGTSISPWIVTMDALEEFRVAAPKQDPVPLEYLRQSKGGDKTAYDIKLGVHLKANESQKHSVISQSNLKHMYWSVSQFVAHHTVNGCNLRPGDLIATGTISGPTEDSFGSLLELSWSGSKKIELEGGVSRTFLQDGDEIKLTGYAQGEGYRIGFGECTGKILPAKLN
ncbi:hypothetical protein MP228_004747 [Amoeboaphelidium protococcarum]|nr:hypothetical protein MP228_004747 [Amoeboaphelidium protococcarum]